MTTFPYTTIRFKSHQDGTTTIEIDGRYAHGRDPQTQGGKYRKSYTLHRATPAQIARVHAWTSANQVGSCTPGRYYQVYLRAQ